MFEKIRFEKSEFRSPFHSTLPQAAGKNIKLFGNIPEEFYENYVDDEQETTFILETEGKTVYAPVPTLFTKQHLLYLQVFSLNKAGKHLYTRRKNYPYYLMIYTYEGKGRLEYRNQKYELSKGDGFLIDCREQHAYYTEGEGWQFALLHYSGVTADWIYQQFIAEGNPVFHYHEAEEKLLQQRLEALLLANQNGGLLREYEVSVQLEQLLLELIKQKRKTYVAFPDYVQYLKQYIDNNFTNPLTLEGLSEFAGVSKYHMDRTFKKYTGSSISAYIINLRLSNATFLLRNSSLSIRQVSESSGFSGYENFLKLFKKTFGMTPLKYRKEGER